MSRSKIIGSTLICTVLVLVMSGGLASAGVANRAGARSVAEGINLKATDLPGWTENPSPTEAADNPLATDLTKCVGQSRRGAVVQVSSSEFTKGTQQEASEVRIDQTAADALRNISIYRNPKIPRCGDTLLRKFYAGVLPKSSHAKVSNVKVDVYRPTEALPGGEALRFKFTVTEPIAGDETTIPFELLIIAFPVGQAEIALLEVEFGSLRPFTIEPTLLHTLDARARAIEAL